ncbi:MAG: PqqD family protein [Planctomycetes bacterium]|nr:PqqD family protein [Planctomycetota bacterium]
MPTLELAPRAPKAPAVADARGLWAPFALYPLRLETPAGWHPFLVEWTAHGARARWETLTATPLEISWFWRDKAEDFAREQKRLEDAWKREAEAAESQAKKLKISFRWTGERRGLQSFAKVDAEGYVREYEWDGRPGCLVVLALAKGDRRCYVAGALCPPPQGKSEFRNPKSERKEKKDRRKERAEDDAADDGYEPLDPKDIAKRVLRSMALAGASDPVRVAFGAFDAELPAGFALESVKAGDAQIFLDARTKDRRINMARVGFADLRLHALPADKLFAQLTKTLFDRSESPDPLTGTQNPFGPGMGKAEEPGARTAETDVHRHSASVFEERRRFHIRFGDWVLRKTGRKWSGGAMSLAWVCPESRSVWALCTRSGEKYPFAEGRERLAGIRCHTHGHQANLDWRGFVADECAEPAPNVSPKTEGNAAGSKPAGAPEENPIAMRSKQLRFRIRTRPEVRLEASSKDATADLVYESAPATGFLARVLRGRAQPQVRYRRLALDPMGRRVWEILSEPHGPAARGVSVGELLAEMSGAYCVHPVEMFPKVLAFMKMLGERRLVEGVPEKA